MASSTSSTAVWLPARRLGEQPPNQTQFMRTFALTVLLMVHSVTLRSRRIVKAGVRGSAWPGHALQKRHYIAVRIGQCGLA